MRACVFRQENTLSAVLCALRGIAAFNRIHIYKSCLGPAGLLVRRRFTAGANGEAPARAPPSSRGWKEAAVRAMWAALPISPLPPAWCCPSRGTTGSRAADATCPEVDVQCWGCMARQDHAMGSGLGSGGACSCCPSKEPTTPPSFSFLPGNKGRDLTCSLGHVSLTSFSQPHARGCPTSQERAMDRWRPAPRLQPAAEFNELISECSEIPR